MRQWTITFNENTALYALLKDFDEMDDKITKLEEAASYVDSDLYAYRDESAVDAVRELQEQSGWFD